MLQACGDDGGGGGGEASAPTTAPTTATEEQPTVEAPATEVAITARDYSFDMPATFDGGLTTLTFTNAGAEPHLAVFATIAPGKTFDEVTAAITAPPSPEPPAGPPPFTELAGFPTADPGVDRTISLKLPAGDYAVFCPLPSPDGTSHAAKGMVSQVTIAEGIDGELPASVGTVEAVDFAFANVPALEAGTNVVRLSNRGRQIHEINLVELGPATTIDEVVAWFKEPTGPPPMRSLSGVAVSPGTEGTAEFELEPGSNYAFICAIPDFLGDFQPHVTKGMFTTPFTATS
ncbi:MAG: hypothetical protein M3N15_04050 [Actinomycetota bacterium]|nr:hypothetical protein [Actinomycetota bacterium]